MIWICRYLLKLSGISLAVLLILIFACSGEAQAQSVANQDSIITIVSEGDSIIPDIAVPDSTLSGFDQEDSTAGDPVEADTTMPETPDEDPAMEDAVSPDTAESPISIISDEGAPVDLSPEPISPPTPAPVSVTNAATYKPLPYFKPILGLGGGFFTYFGDLTPFEYGSRIKDNLAFDASISTRINKYVTMELYFLKGKMTADENSETRNLNFQSSIEAGGLSFSHNFANWIPEKSRVHPFLSLGIEGFNFNSKGDTMDANGKPYYHWSDGTIRVEKELGTNPNAAVTERDYLYESDLREANLDGLKRYGQFSFAIPVGAGVQFRINKRIALQMGTEMHFTFTDNLDNVSAAGSGVREGGANLERFLYTSLSLRYNIGQEDPEPPVEPEDTCIADDDGDGVNNCLDQCPGTPDSVTVDSVGCPVQDTTAAVDRVDSLRNDTSKKDSTWTVMLGKFGPDEFPSTDFINQVLSMPGVWTEVVNDTTYYIKDLFDNPEDAEVQRLNITANTTLKDSKVILWNPAISSDVDIDQDRVNELVGKTDQISGEDVFFRVQIGAFRRQIPTEFFKINDVVMIPGKDGLFKYVTGDFKNDYESAEMHRQVMIGKGFEDAFVVVYRGGERVTLEEVGIIREGEAKDSTGAVIVPVEQEIVYKIQIYASKDPIYMAPVNFKGIENVEEYEDAGLFKYTFGAASDFGYASDVLLNQMRRIGYKDAFVVSFLNGKRIPLEKAFELLEK